MLFTNYLTCFIVLINSISSLSDNTSSKIKWLCAENSCSVPISSAKTVKSYPASDDENKLTFGTGKEVQVLKKPVGGGDLWWVKIDDKVGYVNKLFLRESNVKKTLVEIEENAEVRVSKASKYEVIDGTTVPVDELDLEGDDSDGVVTDEDEPELRPTTGLSASESIASETITPTEATVHLPDNGLPQTATVELDKKPPLLSPEQKLSEEPRKTETPDFPPKTDGPSAAANENVTSDDVGSEPVVESPSSETLDQTTPTPVAAIPDSSTPLVEEVQGLASPASTEASIAQAAAEVSDSSNPFETVSQVNQTKEEINVVNAEAPPIPTLQSVKNTGASGQVNKSTRTTEKEVEVEDKFETKAAQNLAEASLQSESTSLNNSTLSVESENLLIEAPGDKEIVSEPQTVNESVSRLDTVSSPEISTAQDQILKSNSESSSDLNLSNVSEQPLLNNDIDSSGKESNPQLPIYDPQGFENSFLFQGPSLPSIQDAEAPEQKPMDTGPVILETASFDNQTEVNTQEIVEKGLENVQKSNSLPSEPSDSILNRLPEATDSPQIELTNDPFEPTNEIHELSTAAEPEATTNEPKPDEFTTESGPWWPPTFLDSFLGSLQEYLPASLAPSCCSQEAVDVISEKTIEDDNFCEKEECADGSSSIPPPPPPSLRHERAYESSEPTSSAWLSYKAVFLMGFASILVLLFTLGHYYVENLRRDVELASKYNDVSGQLFTEKREKEILEEKLEATQDMLGKIELYEDEIGRLKGEINGLNEEKEGFVKKEKEMSKKYALLLKHYEELKRILTESKQKGERLSLVADIKKLEENAVEYMKNIASLKEQLVDKQGEIKNLSAELQKSNEVKLRLERDLEKSQLDKQDVVKNLQISISELQKSLDENKVTQAKLEDECTQVKKELERLTIEKELAESSLQKAHGLKSSESLSEWLEAKNIRASLLMSEKEIESLKDELNSLKSANVALVEKENYLDSEIKQLNEKYEGAEKEKIDALTRLQVLSDYFKEKETQLQEELGMKEALWVQKQSDDDSLYEQMRSLREENQKTKQVNESLKKEIIEQENSYKKLISTAEEKAYENWVALRHSERRLKEAQMEASQLRARLTSLEASEAHDDKFNSSGPMDTNGELPSFGSAASPPFMLYAGDFLPPPPLVNVGGGGTSGVPPPPPPIAGGPRPPPVGRISSPPLDFTPPPPLVNYGMYFPSSSASPPLDPSSHIVHKPQPREAVNKRPHKDSQSSNQSDSTKDKPMQRNKR